MPFVTGCMTFFFIGHIDGLGIGTILAAFTMGKVVAIIGDILDKNSHLKPIRLYPLKCAGCIRVNLSFLYYDVNVPSIKVYFLGHSHHIITDLIMSLSIIMSSPRLLLVLLP